MSRFSRLFLSGAALFALAGPLLAQWPAPANFGSVAVGSTGQQTVTFTGVPANTSFSVYTGTDFSIAPAVCTGGNCSILVTFTPQHPGLRQGAITASSTASGLLAVAFLYGTGTAPQVAVAPGVTSTVVSRASSLLGSSAVLGGMVVAAPYVIVSDTHGNVVYSVNINTGAVTVFAGNGTQGDTGDSGLATAAELNAPQGLAVDALGDLYIADTGNNVIRRVDAFSNHITTVAGTGTAGNAGDGAAAVSAQLNGPTALSVDAVGNLYIADTGNNRIREVMAVNGQLTSASQIVNFAGNANATAGATGDGGLATSAGLNAPMGIALDAAGNLFIADSGNAVVREVSGGNINRFAGTTGSAGFSGDGAAATSAQLDVPAGVAVDAAGNVYIGDKGMDVIREVAGDSAHFISTIAGTHGTAGDLGDGGPATNATLNAPTMMAVDQAGNVYVLDSGNFAVREITAAPAPVTFPTTALGSSSSPLTLTVSNTGNGDLTVNAAALTGPYSQTGGTCSSSATTTLHAGDNCTILITFAPVSATATTGTVAITTNSLNQTSTQQSIGLSEAGGLHFVAITPCRVIDTRNRDSFSQTFLTGGTERDFPIPGSANITTANCPGVTIPATAAAYSMNVTVVPHGKLSFLTVWPTGQTRPIVSTLNSDDGRIKSNAAIVGTDTNGSISVFATDDTDLVVDVNGYFVGAADANYNTTDLEYYPVTPCRVADTRNTNGALGGPALTLHGQRDFPILTSPCAGTIPNTVKAYSLNIAAVPQGGNPLIYLTAWPTGSQTPPVASSLNAVTGAITSNAAIVPAGSDTNRSVSIYASNATDVVIDINGYFAPPGSERLIALYYDAVPCVRHAALAPTHAVYRHDHCELRGQYLRAAERGPGLRGGSNRRPAQLVIVSDAMVARRSGTARIDAQCRRSDDNLEPGDCSFDNRLGIGLRLKLHRPDPGYLRLFRTVISCFECANRLPIGALALLDDQRCGRAAEPAGNGIGKYRPAILTFSSTGDTPRIMNAASFTGYYLQIGRTCSSSATTTPVPGNSCRIAITFAPKGTTGITGTDGSCQ